MEPIETTETMIPVTRLSRDIVKAMSNIGIAEARYLVDMYYLCQDNRKASGNQVRALNESGEPHEVIAWLFAQNEVLEQQIKRALDKWTDTMPISVWAKGVVGIGPVIAAGLRAHRVSERANSGE